LLTKTNAPLVSRTIPIAAPLPPPGAPKMLDAYRLPFRNEPPESITFPFTFATKVVDPLL
jgi:hypothetical protein